MNPTLPPLGAPPRVTLPPATDTTLTSGLRIVACRLPSVPLVQAHLALPVHPKDERELAALEVLTAALPHRSQAAERLEHIGGSLSSSRRGAWLGLSATCPASRLPLLGDTLAQSLTPAAPSPASIDEARDKVIRQAQLAASQPGQVSQQALLKHLYGAVPAPLFPLASPAHLREIDRQEAAAVHHQFVRPREAMLVVVGDLDPETAVQMLQRRLSSWEPGAGDKNAGTAGCPALATPTLQHKQQSGWVQSHLRLAAPGVDRENPQFPALSVASVVFGGYFSSRLVSVLREQLGLAYRVESAFTDHLDRLLIGVEADTATAATGPALRQLLRELDRFAHEGPTGEETDAALRYMTGVTVLSLASQSGLASTLLSHLMLGQPLDWLVTFTRRLEDVSAAEVREVAGTFYTPARFGGVVVGDLKNLEMSGPGWK
ncbi:M16 family metallopeptidase [Streptomyces sp. NPDC086549]|uniref:M16 family metallopeptidase n=1 Tax=Streptomyces sp. NPDC086549 TaxID=3365752 RepID=UPI00380808F5